MSAAYPMDLEGTVDLGGGHYFRDDFPEGILWFHGGANPECRAWFPVYFQPNERSTGHKRASAVERADSGRVRLTITGSLLCPKCGVHGYIERGRWRDA